MRKWSLAGGTALLSAVALLSGCKSDIAPGGPDVSYLTSALETETPATEKGASFLPLATGNSWDMTASTQGKQNRDRIVVTGPVTTEGVTGIQVETQRSGRRWRREIYQSDSKGVQLVGMQDETSGLMRLSPPIPLFAYPVREGATTNWKGTFALGKESFPAQAYSRISTREDVTTSAGRFKTARIDTVVVVLRPNGEIRFPMVRWLAPSVGFVRRGYAEKGMPAFSEVTRFNVR